MKNHYVLVLSIFGLLCLNHAARAMEEHVAEPIRYDRTTQFMLEYRTFTNEQLLNELNHLENQFSTFMNMDNFTVYMNQPDKLGFLIGHLTNEGEDLGMSIGMLFCAQKIVAVLSLMRYRALTGGELMIELNNLEHQLRGFIGIDNFAEYTKEPDKIIYLYNRLLLLGGRRIMTPELRSCIKNIIAVSLALQTKRQRTGRTE